MGNKISEAQTRRDIIDKRLKKAGWDVSEPAQVTTELDIWVGLPEGISEYFWDTERDPPRKIYGFCKPNCVGLPAPGRPKPRSNSLLTTNRKHHISIHSTPLTPSPSIPAKSIEKPM